MAESIESGTGQPPDEKARRSGEEYYRRTQQEQYAMTDPGHETLKLGTGETAGIVVRVASDLLEDFENLDKKDREITSWSLSRYYEQIAARRRAMNLTVEELDRFKIREPLVINGVPVKDGKGNPVFTSRFPGYGLGLIDITAKDIPQGEETVTDVEVKGFDKDGKLIEGEEKTRIRRTKGSVTLQVPEFGTNEARERIVRIYDKTERMMVVRQDLATLLGDIYIPNTASLENIVTLFHLGRNVPKFSNAELKTLFTLPDFNMVGEKPEDRTLGDCVDLADRLFEIAAVSESKAKLQELMKRPGWQEIVFRYMNEDEIKEWIGDVKNWVDDDQRHKDSINIDPTKTVDGSTDKGKRGLLTEFGNTWARRGKNDEAVLLNRIEWFIAKDYMRRHNVKDVKMALQVAKTAVRLAYAFDKVSGFFAYLGKESYKKITIDVEVKEDGKTVKKKKTVDTPVFPKDQEGLKKLLNDPNRLKLYRDALLLEGDPKTDDLTKLYHFKDYRLKEFLKQRTAGPGVTIPYSEERIALPLILLARSKTPLGWRSFHEQRWGYAETGEPGKPGYMPMEHPKKMGDLNWDITLSISELQETLGVKLDSKEIEEMLRRTSKELNKISGKKEDEVLTDTEGLQSLDVWSLYTLFNWLAGRDDEIKGLYKFYYAEDFDPRLFENEAFWKGKSKFLEIVINIFVKSGGQYRRFYEDLRKQNPGLSSDPDSAEKLDEKLQGVLIKLAEKSYDENRKLFVWGLAHLPNTQVWRATTVETRGAAGATKIPSTYWRLAKETAQKAGFPFPEEFY